MPCRAKTVLPVGVSTSPSGPPSSTSAWLNCQIARLPDWTIPGTTALAAVCHAAGASHVRRPAGGRARQREREGAVAERARLGERSAVHLVGDAQGHPRLQLARVVGKAALVPDIVDGRLEHDVTRATRTSASPRDWTGLEFASGEPIVTKPELWAGGLHDACASGGPWVRFALPAGHAL